MSFLRASDSLVVSLEFTHRSITSLCVCQQQLVSLLFAAYQMPLLLSVPKSEQHPSFCEDDGHSVITSGQTCEVEHGMPEFKGTRRSTVLKSEQHASFWEDDGHSVITFGQTVRLNTVCLNLRERAAPLQHDRNLAVIKSISESGNVTSCTDPCIFVRSIVCRFS
jgi:hypothetical protein